MGELIDLGVKAGFVEKSGSWFSFDNQRIGQGRNNARQFLTDNPTVADALELKIREQAGIVVNAMMTDPTGEELEAAE
jgi:recombination protein RecA